MQFAPRTEAEIKEGQLAPAGDYDFEVLDSANLKSKKGNPMIGVKLGIYSGDAIRWHVHDYLLPLMEAKLRHFCDSTGLLAKYENGSLEAADCSGRSGRCRLAIKEDKTGTYPPQNEVKDYVLRKAKPLEAPRETRPPVTDDDIPDF